MTRPTSTDASAESIAATNVQPRRPVAAKRPTGPPMMPVASATKDSLAERQPGGQFTSIEGVAALVVFLCGPAARDISGAAIPLDCGWTVS